jgi:hypothetical protein
MDRFMAGQWDIIAKDNGEIFKNITHFFISISLFFWGSIKRIPIFYFFSRLRSY